MPLQVLPLERDHVPFLADVLLQDVRTNPIQSLVYKDKLSDQARASYEMSFRCTFDSPQQLAKFAFLRAVDADGVSVAFAQWQKPLDPEPAPKPAAEPAPAPQPSPEAWAAFQHHWTAQDAQSRATALRGRTRYWLLCNIATQPAWRRRGAGALLASWPFAEADQEQVPCILHVDSEGPAVPLYRKLGFEEAARFDVDLRGIGGGRCLTFLCMVREPRPTASRRQGRSADLPAEASEASGSP